MQTKDEQKRIRILDSANTLIVRYGLENISINKIAKYADVSAGTIYIYFKSKDVLIYELYIDRLNSLDHYLRSNIQENTNPIESLESYMQALYNFGVAHPEQLFFIDIIVNSHLRSVYFQNNIEPPELFTWWYKIIESGTKRGFFKQVNPYGAMFLIFHGIVGYLRDIRDQAYTTECFSFDQLIEILISGLQK